MSLSNDKMFLLSAVLALPAKVLGHSDISLTASHQTGEREHSQDGTGNEADSGKTSELPYCKICMCINIECVYIYIYNQIQIGRS